jgi:hypothetical protein
MVAFLPDKNSLSRLPLVEGLERETPLLNLVANPRVIEELLGLKEAEQRKVNVLITNLMILHHTYPEMAGRTQYDQASLLEINGIEVEMGVPKETSNPSKEYHMVEETLILTYDKLAASMSEDELKGLKPFDVFRLYWQAFEFGNIELRHFLLGGPDVPDMATFANEIVEKRHVQEQAFYEKIKEKGLNSLVTHEDGNTAYVELEGEKFPLIKTKSGLWKVKY